MDEKEYIQPEGPGIAEKKVSATAPRAPADLAAPQEGAGVAARLDGIDGKLDLMLSALHITDGKDGEE